jgi:hypothetical protein
MKYSTCDLCKKRITEPTGGHQTGSDYMSRATGETIWDPEKIIVFTAHNYCIEQCEQLVQAKCDGLHKRRIDSLVAAGPFLHTILCRDIVVQIVAALVGDEPIRTQVLKSMSEPS